MSSQTVTLDSVVCPSCAVQIPKRNTGCPHCHYEFSSNLHGRIGSMRDMLSSAQDHQFNNVSPAFLRLFAEAATRSAV